MEPYQSFLKSKDKKDQVYLRYKACKIQKYAVEISM